ncbi:MAG: hypothetical protein NT092_13290 [Bacteroidia bacterium]|nr:hypothetical protein [Bacteroidia bacterium]
MSVKIRIIPVFLLSFFVKSLIFCQDVKLIVEKTETINESSDSTILRDINGDICSQAIVKSDIAGIRFYSNLGIEKVVFDTSYYRVWFSNQASSLKISVPGIPLYEYPLLKKDSPVLYFFILEIANNESTVIYRTDSINKISISTLPVSARLKSQKTVLGHTPMLLDYSELKKYPAITVSKYGYFKKEFAADTLKPGNNYQINIYKLSDRRRFYIILITGIVQGYGIPVYGVQLGHLGKFGYYLSGKSTFKTKANWWEVDFSYTAGVSKSVYIFNLYFGAGYYENNEIYYYRGPGERTGNGFIVDIGLIYNLNRHLIISINTNIRKGNEIEFDYIPFDVSGGIGWSF